MRPDRQRRADRGRALCANLAHELGALVAPEPVGLLDLALPIGSMAQIVGLSHGGNIVMLSQHPPAARSPCASIPPTAT